MGTEFNLRLTTRGIQVFAPDHSAIPAPVIKAMERFDIIARWRREVDKSGAPESSTRRFLGQLRREGKRLGRATLYNWGKAYDRHGLKGLIDGRGLQDSRTIDGECRKLLLSCSDRLEGAALAMVAAIAAAMVNGSHRSRVRAPEPEIRWLPLKDAARHFGLSVGHVRRKCGHEWMCQGKAQLRTGGGIKPRWIVRSDAYPAPAREYLGTAPASSPVPANL